MFTVHSLVSAIRIIWHGNTKTCHSLTKQGLFQIVLKGVLKHEGRKPAIRVLA